MNSYNHFRRRFIQTAGLSSVAVLGGGTSLLSAQGNPEIQLDLSKPLDNVFTIVKIMGDVEGQTVYPFSGGEIYGVLPNQLATPMLKYQSCRIGRYVKQADGSFVFRYRGMIFYQDYESGEFIENYSNPITGKDVKVKHWRSSIGEYALTARGPVTSRKFEGEMGGIHDAPYILPWTRVGDHIWVSLDERVRYKRPSDGIWRTDNAIMRYASRWSEITNPELSSASNSTSWQTAIDWFSWLEMGDTPGGNMQGGAGTKFSSIDELPNAFVNFAESTFPGILTEPIT